MPKILTVYFSIKEQTLGPEMTITDQEKGSTAIAAEFIHKAVGGELFEIKAAEVIKYPDCFEQYDTVFFGYPSLHNTMPTVMFTFLEHFDWTGKRIIPFCSNEGSGLGSSIEDIKACAKGAEVKYGMSLRGSQVKRMEDRISSWAKAML